MPQMVRVYRLGMREPELVGHAEVVDHEPQRYFPDTGQPNPYVFGHVRFFGTTEVVPALLAWRDFYFVGEGEVT